MTDLTETVKRIRELAGKATPGPWGRVGVPYYEYWIVRADEAEGVGHKHTIAAIENDGCLEGGYYVNTQRDANAAYIAAANPQAVSAILAELERVTGGLLQAQEDYKAMSEWCDARDERITSLERELATAKAQMRRPGTVEVCERSNLDDCADYAGRSIRPTNCDVFACPIIKRAHSPAAKEAE